MHESIKLNAGITGVKTFGLLSFYQKYDLYNNIELPLLNVIARIEQNGVMIDAKSLKKQSLDLSKRISSIEKNELYNYCNLYVSNLLYLFSKD